MILADYHRVTGGLEELLNLSKALGARVLFFWLVYASDFQLELKKELDLLCVE